MKGKDQLCTLPLASSIPAGWTKTPIQLSSHSRQCACSKVFSRTSLHCSLLVYHITVLELRTLVRLNFTANLCHAPPPPTNTTPLNRCTLTPFTLPRIKHSCSTPGPAKTCAGHTLITPHVLTRDARTPFTLPPVRQNVRSTYAHHTPLTHPRCPDPVHATPGLSGSPQSAAPTFERRVIFC